MAYSIFKFTTKQGQAGRGIDYGGNFYTWQLSDKIANPYTSPQVPFVSVKKMDEKTKALIDSRDEIPLHEAHPNERAVGDAIKKGKKRVFLPLEVVINQ